MWYYGLQYFYQKQILQAPWLELVGFLSQNYITLHNNLVNMIFLYDIFPQAPSICEE